MGAKQTVQKPDPKEVAKEQKKVVRGAQRKLAREVTNIDRQEKKTLTEIKKMAEKGQHGPAKILSKDVARQRSQKNQYLMMGSQLKAMEMQMASSAMNEQIMTALSGSTQVMMNVNENMDVAGVRNTLMEFNKQMGKAEMNQEIMGDAMDMMDGEGVGADADDVYDGILGEIGLAGANQVGNNIGTGVIQGQQ